MCVCVCVCVCVCIYIHICIYIYMYTAGASVHAFSDSQLVISQLYGAYKAKDDTMAAYV